MYYIVLFNGSIIYIYIIVITSYHASAAHGCIDSFTPAWNSLGSSPGEDLHLIVIRPKKPGVLWWSAAKMLILPREIGHFAASIPKFWSFIWFYVFFDSENWGVNQEESGIRAMKTKRKANFGNKPGNLRNIDDHGCLQYDHKLEESSTLLV